MKTGRKLNVLIVGVNDLELSQQVESWANCKKIDCKIFKAGSCIGGAALFLHNEEVIIDLLIINISPTNFFEENDSPLLIKFFKKKYPSSKVILVADNMPDDMDSDISGGSLVDGLLCRSFKKRELSLLLDKVLVYWEKKVKKRIFEYGGKYSGSPRRKKK